MLDLMFASYLLFLLPGWQLWKSLKKKEKDSTPDTAMSPERLVKNLVFILTPLCALAVLMAVTGRAPAALGLDIPVSSYGQWGLLFVVVLMIVPFVWSAIADRNKDQQKK